MQSIFEILYHFVSGCTFGIKTAVYYLGQVPDHVGRFYTTAQRFIAVIPAPWGVITSFGLVSAVAMAFIRKKGA